MNRLVVVSNRTPSDGPPAAGGVAVALNDILKDQGGVWFGWSGQVGDTRSRTPQIAERDGITFATIDLTEADISKYYEGFANSALWPVFHQRPDLARFDTEHYRTYQSVNRYFANRLVPLLKPSDHVWVHDYHFIPLAAHLRRRNTSAALGFFLHIPVPPPQALAALPQHRELCEALVAYDLLGFQTVRDQQNFLSYATEELGLPVDRRTGAIETRGRTVHTAAFPIGTDPDAFARMATDPAAERMVACLRPNSDTRFAIGVDRLDYTKGLLHRIRAFEHFLGNAPDHRRRVSLLQIAPPSRQGIAEYAEVSCALNRACGNVNGLYGDLDWLPVRYIRRPLPQTQLASLYRAARVGLVTSLCDGMNLVAKEYVASQDPIDPGVLILSRFAGAAAEMEDALIVNPHDVVGCAAAIREALEMPLADRRARWSNLMAGLRDNTVFDWRDRFLARLSETVAPGRAEPRQPDVRVPEPVHSGVVDWRA